MLDIPAAWRAILALSDERQFSRAASRLGMSQPQLSRLIANVEKRFGFRIFERRPYATATSPGQVLIKAIRGALDELEEATCKAERIVAGTGGHVTIGFASTVMATSFPLWLKTFARDYPDVVITLKEMHSAEQEHAVIDGSIDLALGREASTSSEMQSKLLFEDDLVAALSSSDPLAAHSIVALGDLAQQPFIMFDRSCAPSLHELIMRTCGDARFSPRIAHVAREWHTVLALVAAGYGVSLVPASLRALRWPNLCFRALETNERPIALYLQWPRAGLSPAATALMNGLKGADFRAPASAID